MENYTGLAKDLRNIIKQCPSITTHDANVIEKSADAIDTMDNKIRELIRNSASAICQTHEGFILIQDSEIETETSPKEESSFLCRESYTLYTDGACSGNPGPGGWAAIIINNGTGQSLALSGGCKDTTNNRMEMLAVIEGLKTIPDIAKVKLLSDSQYVIKTLTDGWKRNKNADLWEQLDALCESHIMDYEWVKGHASNKHNNACDKLAVKAAKGIKAENT